MSFGGSVDLGSAHGAIEIGSDLKGLEDARKSLATFQKQAQAAGKQIAAQFKSIGDAAKQAGQVMSLAVTAPLVLAGKNAITAASDLNEAMSAVETVFGDASASVIAFAETSDKNLGISKEAALSAATQYAGLATQAGLTGQAQADFSQQLLQNAADLGSFYNQDPTEVLDALRSGLIGETEPLRRFNILISDAQVQQKALEMGLAATKDEITDGMKVQARYALIQEQLGAAQGDFARTSGGLANAQRILAATVTNLSATLGQVMLPTVLKGVQALQGFAERIQAMSAPAQALIVKLGLVAAAAGPALIVFGQIVSALAKVGPALALLTGPLGLVVAGLAALAVAWKTNFGGIQDITREALGTVGDVLGRMIQFFGAARERGLDPFDAAFAGLIAGLKENVGEASPITDFVIELYRVINDLGDAIKKGDWEGFFATLERAGKRLGRWIEEAAQNALAFGGELLTNLKTSLDQVKWGEIASKVGDGIRGALEIRHKIIEGLLTLGGEILQTALKGLEGVNWSQVGETVVAGIGSFAEWMGDTVGGEAAFGASVLQRLIDGFEGINWSLIGDTIKEGIAGVNWDQVGQAVKDGLGDFATLAGDFLGGALTFAGSLVQTIWKSFEGVNWDQVGTEIQKGVEFALDRLSELGTWILDRLKETDWDALGTSLQTLATVAFFGLITAARTQLETYKNLGQWILDRLGEVDWDSVGAALEAFGRTTFFLLIQGATGAIDQLKNFGQWVLDRLAEVDWETVKATLATAARVAFFALISAAKLQLETYKNIGQWILDELGKVDWASVITFLTTKGGDLLGGLLKGSADKLVEVAGWLQSLPTALEKATGETLESLKQKGIDLIEGLWKGITARLDTIDDDIRKKWDEVVGGLKLEIPTPSLPFGNPFDQDSGQNASANTGESGKEAIQGYVDGGYSQMSTVDQLGRDTVQTLDSSIASEQQSASPSKLMAKRGEEAGRGYAVGLGDTLGPISDEAAAIVQAVSTQLRLIGGDDTPRDIVDVALALQQVVNEGQASTQMLQNFVDELRDLDVSDAMRPQVEAAANQLQGFIDKIAAGAADGVTEGLTEQKEAYQDYSENVGKIYRGLQGDLKKLDQERTQSARQAAAEMIDIERAYTKQVRDLNKQAAEAQQQAQEELADLAQQRADAQVSAEEQIADAQTSFAESQKQNAQQIAEINRGAQQQAQEAARAWQEMNKANLQAQKEIRVELQKTLQEARRTFRESMSGFATDIAEVRSDLATSLADSQRELTESLADFARDTLKISSDLADALADLEFDATRDKADNELDEARTREDLARDLAENARQAAEAQEDLTRTLNDPTASVQDRGRAQEETAKRLADLARQRESIEFEAARRLQDLELQRQRQVEDAAIRQNDLAEQAAARQAEIERQRQEAVANAEREEAARREEAAARIRELQAQQAAAERQYREEQKAARQQAREDERTLEKERAQALKDSQRDRLQAERDTAAQIKAINATQADAAQELANSIKGIRAELAKSLQGLAEDENAIYRDQNTKIAEIERDRRILARDTARDRGVAAREAAHEEELIQRARLQAEKEADRLARQEARAYQKTQQGEELSEAAPHGQKVGQATGQGIGTGLQQSQGQVKTAAGQLRTAVEQGVGDTNQMRQLGANVGMAFVQGVQSRVSDARAAGAALARAAAQGTQQEAEISSPSRVFADLGINSGLGYVQGLRSIIPEADRAARDMVAATARQANVGLAQQQQAAGWASVGQQVVAERRRRAQVSPFPQMPQNLHATVVIDDAQLGQVVIGHAITPLMEALDRTQGGGTF